MNNKLLLFILTLFALPAYSQNQSTTFSSIGVSNHTLDAFDPTYTGSILSPTKNQSRYSLKKPFNLGLKNGLNANTKAIKTTTARDLPRPTIGVYLSPFFHKVNFNSERGVSAAADYEHFLSKRLSVLGGVEYLRRWTTNYDFVPYHQQDVNIYIQSRFRFTNPDRKLAFFVAPSVMYSFRSMQVNGGDWNSIDNELRFLLDVGAEWKLSKKLRLTASIGPSWGGSNGFNIEPKLGLRIKL